MRRASPKLGKAGGAHFAATETELKNEHNI